jgi:hypothetical protein
MTLQAMADAMGITKQILLRAEAGGVPRVSNQAAIARVYGLDVVVQWPDPDEAAAA